MKNNANRIQSELTQQRGIFTISLDFELGWGFVGKRNIKQYAENFLGVYSAIPAILEIFNEYNIHATWATVGFLFFDCFYICLFVFMIFLNFRILCLTK